MDGIEIQEGSLTSIQSTNRKPKYFPFPDVHGRELSSAIMIQDCIGAGVATTMQSWSRYAACQQRVASCMWSCTTLTAQVCFALSAALLDSCTQCPLSCMVVHVSRSSSTKHRITAVHEKFATMR